MRTLFERLKNIHDSICAIKNEDYAKLDEIYAKYQCQLEAWKAERKKEND